MVHVPAARLGHDHDRAGPLYRRMVMVAGHPVLPPHLSQVRNAGPLTHDLHPMMPLHSTLVMFMAAVVTMVTGPIGSAMGMSHCARCRKGQGGGGESGFEPRFDVHVSL